MLDEEYTEEAQITVLPYVTLAPLFLRFEFFDEEENFIYESHFVELKATNDGSLYKRWEGKSSDQPITYVLELNLDENKLHRIQIDLDKITTNAAHIKAINDVIEALSKTAKVKLFNLKNKVISTIKLAENLWESNLHPLYKEFVNLVVFIEDTLQVEIPIPEQVPEKELLHAREIANIITTGKSEKISVLPKEFEFNENSLPALRAVFEYQTAIKLYDDFKKDGSVSVYSPLAEETLVALLEQQVNLGASRRMIFSSQIINENELKSVLARGQSTSNDDVNIDLVIDLERSYISFGNFPKSALDSGR